MYYENNAVTLHSSNQRTCTSLWADTHFWLRARCKARCHSSNQRTCTPLWADTHFWLRTRCKARCQQESEETHGLTHRPHGPFGCPKDETCEAWWAFANKRGLGPFHLRFRSASSPLQVRSQILEFEGMFSFSIKLFYKAKEIILSKKRRNQLLDVVLFPNFINFVPIQCMHDVCRITKPYSNNGWWPTYNWDWNL